VARSPIASLAMMNPEQEQWLADGLKSSVDVQACDGRY
jgi:hypothetical protein